MLSRHIYIHTCIFPYVHFSFPFFDNYMYVSPLIFFHRSLMLCCTFPFFPLFPLRSFALICLEVRALVCVEGFTKLLRHTWGIGIPLCGYAASRGLERTLALPRVCAPHSNLESQVPDVTADKQSFLPPSFLHLCLRAPGT